MQSNTSSNIIQSERAMSVLVGSLVVGCLTIPFYAAQTSTLGQFASVVGVAVGVACSALLAGGLLGFLFGIPRTLQQTESQSMPNSDEKQQQQTAYAVNTNLEQISDWLTKILVGVGLTQISTIPAALGKYANYISLGLGNYPNSKVFSVALLIFFLIDGFLISYLWTRLYLAGALRQADATSRLSAVETKLDIIDIDAKAWSTVQRLLNPAPGGEPLPQREINASIIPATNSMKAQIFWEAQQFRSRHWRNLVDKPKMERTIPIFRALIASDTENVYHANHGQLGFALKDKRTPNWEEAFNELTEAINLRGDWEKSGWSPHYEFARAICRMKLDEAYQRGEPSDDKTRKNILSDLEVAVSDPDVKDKVLNEPEIKEWLKRNNAKLG